MLPPERCVLCGKLSYHGSPRQCAHSDEEWERWKREQFLPEIRDTKNSKFAETSFRFIVGRVT